MSQTAIRTKQVREATAHPVDWDALPEVLVADELRVILRKGRDATYQWMRQHPGLVMRSGNEKSVAKETLRKFLAGDPVIRGFAFTDPYARPQHEAAPAPARGSHLRPVAGGLT